MALTNCKLIGSGGLPNKVIIEGVSSGAAGNLANAVFNIVPDEGFVIDAEDFNVDNVSFATNGSLTYTHGTNGVNFPGGGITSLTLENTYIGGELGNKVKVTIDIDNNYNVSSNANLTIDIDGAGKPYNPTIDVVPHIVDTAYLLPYPNVSMSINKESNNPPVIDNTDKKVYQHTTDSYDITYLPCTIQPGTSTKIATIIVDAPASPGGGAFFSITTPPSLTSIGGGGSNAMFGVNKYELVEVQSSQVVQNNGAVTKRVFDLFYQNVESAAVSMMSTWPSNYDTVGSLAYTDGCRIVLSRPVLINALESSTDNTIDVISMHDEIAIDTGEVPVKVVDDGNVTLFDTDTLNPTENIFAGSIGTITKATEDEPNIVSIQGTPGTQFTLLLQQDGTNKSGNGGLETGTQTIPESGVFKTAMTDIDENLAGRAGGTATINYDLKIQAVGTSAVSQSAGRAQQQGSIAAGDANSITLRYVQPIGVAKIKLTGGATSTIGTNSQVDVSNTTNTTGLGGADPSNSVKCRGAEISGVGMSLIETQTQLNASGVQTAFDDVSFTMTRSGTNGRSNSCVITGKILFNKFGNDDLNIDIDFDSIFEEDGTKSPIEFVVKSGKANPTGASSDGSTETLGDFTLSASGTGVEFSIYDVVASVT